MVQRKCEYFNGCHAALTHSYRRHLSPMFESIWWLQVVQDAHLRGQRILNPLLRHSSGSFFFSALAFCFFFFFFFWVVSSINNNNNNIIERSRRCTPDRITAGKMFINLHTVFFSFLPFISLSLSLSLPAKKLFIVVLHFLITPQISMPLDTHTQFKNVSCPIFPIKNSQHKPSAYEIIISFDYCNTLRTQDIQFLIKADIFFPWHIICAYIKNKKRNKKKPIHNMCHGKKCHGKFFFLYR